MSVEAVNHRSRVDHEPTPEPPRASSPARSRTNTGSGAQSAARTARAATSRPPPSPAEIRQNLDVQYRAMSGPYMVAGTRVEVSAAFRMIDGYNPVSSAKAVALVHAAVPAKTYASLGPSLGYVTAGKGTPAQIRAVTQALIDSPAWKKYQHISPVENAIRQLMWDHCIGADCSGYTHNAFLASRSATSSRYSLGSPLQSAIQQPPKSVFRKIEKPEEARSGDVLLLGPPPKDTVGHKVIVYDRQEVPTGSALHAAARKSLGSTKDAKLHVFVVDSSWGASGDPQQGGVERRRWIYDESTQKWGALESRGIVQSTAKGPYDHPLQGIYRPTAER